jgi:hypothetical protein
MLRKLLRFGRMHEKKLFFCFFFVFVKEEINFKKLRFVFEYSKKN